MRRTGVILACVAVLLTATASPAAAHPLPRNSQVPLGRAGTVTIGIPSEANVAMTGVDIEIPSTYRVLRPEPPPGWTAVVAGGQIRYGHGSVAPGSFALFSFRGVASKRGRLKFVLVIHSASGHAQRWAGTQGKDPYPAVVVYAGVPPAAAGPGPNLALLAGWGLVVIGLCAAVWWWLRGRRLERARLHGGHQVGASASHP
jgi:hypothetical protein